MTKYVFTAEVVNKVDMVKKKSKGRKQAPEITWVLEELKTKGIEEAIKMTAPDATTAIKIYFSISKFATRHKLAVGCSRVGSIVYAYNTEKKSDEMAKKE